MNAKSRMIATLPAVGLLAVASGCGGADTTSVSGSVAGFNFGTQVSAIAGTFWGADDGLNIVVTDADDPCDALTHQRRQPNTSVLVLGFLDATGPTKLDSTSITHSGSYQFTTEPLGPGRWFRVIRAFHLDGSCAATAPGGATAGSGTLSEDMPLNGGTADGSFSAQFGGGSLSGDFVAPFCQGLEQSGPLSPMGPAGCSYYSPIDGEACTCGTAK